MSSCLVEWGYAVVAGLGDAISRSRSSSVIALSFGQERSASLFRPQQVFPYVRFQLGQLLAGLEGFEFGLSRRQFLAQRLDAP